MFDRILVPLDGSERAEAILSQVRRLLKRKESEIILARVAYEPPTFSRFGPVAFLPEARGEAQRYIREATRRLEEEGVRVRGVVREGLPAETLLDAAKKEGADLIAMATHGRSGLERWAFGSISEKVMRASEIPVLLLRSFKPGAGGEFAPAGREEIPFRKILVPTDGSDISLAVIPVAREFARLFEAEVVVLHVRAPVMQPVAAGFGIMYDPAPLPLQPAAAPEDKSESVAEAFAVTGLRVTSMTVEGDAAAQILDTGQKLGIDLIAMATHGRSGVSRWVLGSVTERVLRGATVPMLIVHPRSAGRAAKRMR